MINYAAFRPQQGSRADFAGSYAQGQNAALRGQEIQKRNRLAQLYQEQGAGLVNGDPNSVNALAQIDAPAAAQFKGSAAAESAAARKNELGKLGMLAGALYGVRTPEEYQQAEDNLVSAGVLTREDAARYNFGMLPQIIGSVRGLEGQLTDQNDRRDFDESVRQFNLKFVQGQNKPADEYARYVQEETSAGRQPLSRIEFAQAKKGKGTTISYDEAGRPVVSIGGAANGSGSPKLNETESKGLIYYDRANAAEAILNQHEKQLTDIAQKSASGVPVVGNYLVSDEFQQANQAGREFLASILRKDTGAAITNQEFELYGPMFLPQPGDSAAVLEQKKESRRIAVDAIKKTLGNAGGLADERTGAEPTGPQKTIDGVTYEQRNGKWGIVQ